MSSRKGSCRAVGLSAVAALSLLGCYDLDFAPFQPPPPPWCPTVEWQTKISGPGEDFALIDVTPTAEIAVAGSFQRQTVLGKGEPKETLLTSDDTDDRQGFVARYGPGGSLSWAQHQAASGPVSFADLAALPGPSGAFVVTGSFSSTLTFGVGTDRPIALAAGTGQNIFVAFFEADGTVSWARGEGSSRWDSAWAVATSETAPYTIVVTGVMQGDATFGEGMDTVVLEHSDPGEDQAFMAAYDEAGTLLWVNHTWGEANFNDLVVKGDRIYVTGSFKGETQFRSAETEDDSVTLTATPKKEDPEAPVEADLFVAAYDRRDGRLVWIRQAGGEEEDIGWSIETLSDGSVLVAGKNGDKPDFNQDGQPDLGNAAAKTDVFLARYDEDHELDWVVAAAVSDGRDFCSDLAVDEDDSGGDVTVLLTGAFDQWGTISGTGNSAVTLTALGSADDFVAAYTGGGALRWAHRIGGSGYREPLTRSIIHADSAVISGAFDRELTFGEGDCEQVIFEERASSGESTAADAYVLRLSTAEPTE